MQHTMKLLIIIPHLSPSQQKKKNLLLGTFIRVAASLYKWFSNSPLAKREQKEKSYYYWCKRCPRQTNTSHIHTMHSHIIYQDDAFIFDHMKHVRFVQWFSSSKRRMESRAGNGERYSSVCVSFADSTNRKWKMQTVAGWLCCHWHTRVG